MVLLLMLVSSTRRFYNPSAELLQTFYPNDVVNLLIGLPLLLGSMWLASRRVLARLLMWPGTLFLHGILSKPPT